MRVKKVVVKAHGASNDTAFKNAIVRAKEMVDADVCAKIANALGSDKQELNEVPAEE